MNHRRGVSLIELLVVIGLVALLLSLLVPGVGAAREGARASECAGRLKQLAVAAQTYATTFREVFPPAILYQAMSGGVRTVAWDFAHSPDGSIRPGPLWSFTDNPDRVQQCPSFVGPSTFGQDPFTGFNYNTSFIGAEGSFPTVDGDGRIVDGWDRARRGLSAAQHRRPSQTALFGDGGWIGGANKFMRSPSSTVEMNLSLTYAGGQAFRHCGCTNVAWLDGHVSGVSQPCRGMLAQSALLASPMGWPDQGFLSEDDTAYDPR
ncbi:MAG: DUF1559 domain-containing protein [Phycisphaerales bacterium]|nr:DUF1559 domain-containing protein [Phycisphaerales bacterium]